MGRHAPHRSASSSDDRSRRLRRRARRACLRRLCRARAAPAHGAVDDDDAGVRGLRLHPAAERCARVVVRVPRHHAARPPPTRCAADRRNRAPLRAATSQHPGQLVLCSWSAEPANRLFQAVGRTTAVNAGRRPTGEPFGPRRWPESDPSDGEPQASQAGPGRAPWATARTVGRGGRGSSSAPAEEAVIRRRREIDRLLVSLDAASATPLPSLFPRSERRAPLGVRRGLLAACRHAGTGQRPTRPRRRHPRLHRGPGPWPVGARPRRRCPRRRDGVPRHMPGRASEAPGPQQEV